jgi:hypothetical protein
MRHLSAILSQGVTPIAEIGRQPFFNFNGRPAEPPWPAYAPELKLYLPNTLVFCSFVMLFMVHAALLRMVAAP